MLPLKILSYYYNTTILFVTVGKGNITASAEYNIYADAEAAFVVLNELGCPIIMVPWETCLDHALPWVGVFLTRWLFSQRLHQNIKRKIKNVDFNLSAL